MLHGPRATMLSSRLPVIAISAVRTGCGKSQTARWIVRRLASKGWRVAALRHPMPYGDLARQRAQRFASRDDLSAADCSIEEREEYEPYVDAGAVVYAGVDYAEVVAQAERGVDMLVWDGGNNDYPFLRPDLHLVVVDALRPDQLTTHHPGETALRMADVVVVNKMRAAAACPSSRPRPGACGASRR
jgi:predicted GTPase